VARLCGVKVLRFCLGFGTPVVSKRVGPDQTEWGIAAIPLGGYVKMLDEREGTVDPHEVHRAFNRQSVGKRMAILVAGPAFNFILAIALYWGIFGVGMEEPKAIIGAPPAESMAARAGLLPNMTITAVNDEPVQSWTDLRWRVLKVAVDRGDARLTAKAQDGFVVEAKFSYAGLSAEELEGDFLRRQGIAMARPQPVVARVLPGSVAERSGLQAGDLILRIAGDAISSGDAAVQAIRLRPQERVPFEVRRGSTVVQVAVTPDVATDDAGKRIGRIGAEIGGKPEMVTVRYGVVGSLGKAVSHTWDMSVFSLKMMGKMIVGQISPKNISGPVTIADYAGKSARLGLDYYISFLALISVSLGVLNLLPIPLLDGGHLLYYAIEAVRGKPVSETVMEWGQRFGIVALGSLMVLALWNDIHRVIVPLFAG
jgi:regulator of sigma E protease